MEILGYDTMGQPIFENQGNFSASIQPATTDMQNFINMWE